MYLVLKRTANEQRKGSHLENHAIVYDKTFLLHLLGRFFN